MATYAITTFTGKIKPKTVTVKFKTFGLFTIAGNSFVWVFLFWLMATYS